MMKQPAENTNATVAEAEAASARTTPVSLQAADIREQVAKVAYQLWQERQGAGGSPEEDWRRAEEIVAKRWAATSKA
ncbi:MAG TPA: DUF2934 domain-containing protein [Bryobacteraceae bacterium]|nr:DUF2934 domain-containing protein [Bryobacteraceae bacterium]